MDYQTVSDLPNPYAGKVDWEGITAFARKQPIDKETGHRRWVEVPVPLSPGVPYQITKGTYPNIPTDEFEVTSRKIHQEGPRRVTVYLRAKS